MIASIIGSIRAKGSRFVVVETGGIGYKVFVTMQALPGLKVGSQAKFSTYQHVSENALELYGFLQFEETEFFESLLTVSGVGPKTALNVMSVASLDELREAIVQADSTLLTKVSGVGRKTSERIVLELQEKVKLGILPAGTLKEDAEVLDALVSLGYSRNEARHAVRRIPKTVKGVSDRVREALKRVGSHGD